MNKTAPFCLELCIWKTDRMGSNYAKEKRAILLKRGKRRQVWTDL